MHFGELVSTILDRVSDAACDPHECISSEQMCRGLQDANARLSREKVDPERVILGSMDAVGLFPSLKINESLRILKIMLLESEISY